MLLSRPEILSEFEAGNILISPFNVDNLGPNSYDVTFGPWVWRETVPPPHFTDRPPIYNPYAESEVRRVFYKCKAQPAKETCTEEILERHEINPDEYVVFINPGESILGHTVEFIGGCSNNITTKMFARSSIGRNFLEVCRCAGMGDIGYCTRWTMEITNNSRFYSIPLVVGKRIAQIEFSRTAAVEDKYTKRGKYQTEDDPKKLQETWEPEMMLPKMYLDREVK